MTDWDENHYKRVLGDFGQPGLRLTAAMAGQLCDQLELEDISVSRILHSNHTVAEQTARVFANILTERKPCCPRANPYVSCEYLSPGTENTVELVRTIERLGGSKDKKTASILIGHQPQLTMIARRLLGRRLPANVLPLGNSEIACIELGESPRLLWLLTEKSSDLLGELKTKIASKYDVAKFFLGALVVGNSLTLGKAIWDLPEPIDKFLAGCGAFAALVSLGLTAATLFSYDRLLMPRDFWSEEGKDSAEDPGRGTGDKGRPPRWTVSRPPSQAHMLLFYEMVHIWKYFFYPAIGSAFAGLGLVLVAMADNSATQVSGVLHMQANWRLVILLALALFAFVIGLVAYYLWKPRLGFDD